MNAPFHALPISACLARPLAPSLERWRLRAYLSLMMGDIVCLLAGFLLAGGLYLGEWPSSIAMMEAQLLLPVFLTIALYHGAYSIKTLTAVRFAIRRALVGLAIASALLIFITFYTKSTTAFSRGTFTLALLFTACGMAGIRIVGIAAIRRSIGPSVSNVLVIRDGGPEVTLANALFVDADEHQLAPDMSDPHSLDRLGRYLLNMDRVVVSCPLDKRVQWAAVLRASGVRGEVISEVLQDLRPIALVNHDSFVSLVVSAGPLGMRARAVKRLFDIAMAGIGLVALSPILALTACAIKLEDGGPVLFTQRRLGRGNRFFDVLKFRSMRVENSDESGVQSASPGDSRLTRVGRFIRRTSVDELPQLWNVLRGDMSLVGPRPHALGSQAGDKLFWEVDGRYWHRHSLRPGLTGLAQVRGLRGATDRESDLQDRLQSDLEYIEHWNPFSDIAIVFRTLGVLVHRRAF